MDVLEFALLHSLLRLLEAHSRLFFQEVVPMKVGQKNGAASA